MSVGLLTLIASVVASLGLTSVAPADDEFALELDHGHIDAFTMVLGSQQLVPGIPTPRHTR